ncbi:MAG: hypothetical protein AABY40_04170 [Nanoarchaeota archaeon]
MKLSYNTERNIVWGSVLGTMAGVGGMFYFITIPSPDEELMKEFKQRQDSLSQQVLQCVPREKGRSLSDQCIDSVLRSDQCIDSVLRYDSVNKNIDTLQKLPAYITSKDDQKYSLYLGIFAGACLTLNLFLSERRKKQTSIKGDQ